MILSAGIHNVILIFKAVSTWDFTYLNYFNILDLEFVFKGLTYNATSNIMSAIVVILIFLFFYETAAND